MSFSSLGLSPALAKAAAGSGYVAPTGIQSAAIPVILSGGDVLAQARTGSGKTAAFSLPLLQGLVERPVAGPRRARALILVPTRELAAQVGAAVTALAAQLPVAFKVATLFGGVSINPQMMGLRGGADIVVATPGRLLDLVEHNALSLAGVAMLVLDEADRLLDLGFTEELNKILALLPEQRQTLFFSATYPPAVTRLAGRMLNNPQRIDVAGDGEEGADAPDIVQRAIAVDVPRRLQLLKHLIVESGWRQVLVFVATKYAAMHVADKLQRNGIDAAAFHGEISQGGRTGVLRDFKSGALRVMVATDVAARGIDIALLPVVVNFDLPRSAVDYTHRIGRTGRAGESGLAVSFVSADTEAHFKLIEKRQGVSVPREIVAGFEPVETAAAVAVVIDATDPNGGVKGKRKSKKDKLREAAALAKEPGDGADGA
jgi:superfamily II DNA/RNA helicase